MYFKYTISETIKKPEKRLEPFILENPKTCYEYSKNILNKRWLKAENSIINLLESGCPHRGDDLEYVYLYSKNVIKSRWNKAEELFLKYMKNFSENTYSQKNFNRIVSWAYFYTKNVIKGRWKEIEEYIIKSDQIGNYIDVLKDEKEVKEFKIAISLSSFKDIEQANNFSTWKPTHKVKIKGSKSFDAMILKNQYQRSKKYDYLVFKMEEWLNQAKHYNNKDHCYSYYMIQSMVESPKDSSSKEIETEFYGGARFHRKRKIDAKVELI